MYFLLFVLIFFLLLTTWWFEAKYNYFHDIWTDLKKVCPWIDMQTKFKLAICKVFLVSLVLTLIICIWNVFYSPYVDQYLSFNNWKIDLAEKTNKSNPITEINQDSSLPLKIEIVNDDSQIGDWGTFGDFIGGTLNPIIGFISIILLFATWKLTRKTLDFTKEELKNSNEILNIQQFDAIFWGLLGHLKKIEELLYQKDNDQNLILDSVYHRIFLYKLDESISEKRQKILRNAEISQYFIVLYQIFKNIDEKIDTDNFKLKKSYSNILRANISTKILQLLAVNCYEDFPEYKKHLEKFNFLEHMPFYFIMDHRLVNLKLLECLAVYDQNIFDRSIYFKEYLNDRALKLFFEGNPKNIDSYLSLLLTGLVERNEIEVEVDLAHNQSRKFDLIIEIEEGKSVFIYPKNKENIYGVLVDDIILRGDKNRVNPDITKRGLEFKIYNVWIIINSLKNVPIQVEKTRS